MHAQLMQEVVGGNVRRLRLSRTDYSQVELGTRVAQRLGVAVWSSATMSAAENGRREFTASEVAALAVELGVLPGALLLIPESVEAVVIGGKRDRAGQIVGGTSLGRDEVQPLAAVESDDARSAQLAQLATTALGQLGGLTDSLDELHTLALQLRVDALRVAQGSTPATNAGEA